jgi:hypothetical protein
MKEACRQPRFVATKEPVCEGANQAEREMRPMRWPENTSDALRILVNAPRLTSAVTEVKTKEKANAFP